MDSNLFVTFGINIWRLRCIENFFSLQSSIYCYVPIEEHCQVRVMFLCGNNTLLYVSFVRLCVSSFVSNKTFAKTHSMNMYFLISNTWKVFVMQNNRLPITRATIKQHFENVLSKSRKLSSLCLCAGEPYTHCTWSLYFSCRGDMELSCRFSIIVQLLTVWLLLASEPSVDWGSWRSST